MLKKISLIILLILTLFITSCTEVVTTCTVTVNDGTNTTEYTINKGDNLTFLESPTKFKHQFAGWYDGDKLINVNNPVEEDLSIEAKFEYVYNQTGFDGNGMEYKIYFLNNFGIYGTFIDDLYDVIEDIDNKYNIRINIIKSTPYEEFYMDSYSNLYANERRSETDKTNYNYDAVIGLDLQVLNSSYFSKLGDKLSQFVILDDETDNSIFKQYGYTQSEFASSQVTIDGNVYGYNPNPIYYNSSLISINKDIVKKYNLEDPYEMYLKGEWTFSNFQKWIDDAYNKSKECEFDFLTMINNDFESKSFDIYKNFSAGLGYPVCNNSTSQSLCYEIESHYDLSNYMNVLYDISKDGYTGDEYLYNYLIHSFSTNYYSYGNPTDFYFLPYPMADDQKGELVLSNDSNDAQCNVYGDAITDDNGNYITAIDLTNTTFKMCCTTFNNAYFISKVEDNNFGFTNEISFEIIYDLLSLVNNTDDTSYYCNYLNFYDISYEINYNKDSIQNFLKYSSYYADESNIVYFNKYYSDNNFYQIFNKTLINYKLDKDKVKTLFDFEYPYWFPEWYFW